MSDEELAQGVGEPPPDEAAFDPDEPREGSRMSPYVIGAFATSMFGLWNAPRAIGGLGELQLQDLIVMFLGVIIPIVAAAVAWWMSNLGEDEIEESDGRLRGWNFCRAARIIATVTIVIAGASIAVNLLLSDEPLRFGFEAWLGRRLPV